MTKTGGGSYTPALTQAGALVLEIIADQVTPLMNPYDDGAQYHGIKWG